jgi:NADP-dependent 3-hydroxy acid dehydrogenase YdfG
MRHLPQLDGIGGPADGLICIVTGSTSGIGKEAAGELARRGAHGEKMLDLPRHDFTLHGILKEYIFIQIN